ISQYDLPVGINGKLQIEVGDKVREIGITRVHMEEDTGKLIHKGKSGRISGADYSLVDFNRAGIPLVEIVSEPDIRTPEEAKAFMRKLRNILLHLEVSDCNMEEGSLRCDANISIREKGTKGFGTKAEIKNLNSFKALQRGLEYEIERHTRTLNSGDKIFQETRHFDAARNVTILLRTKEEAHDYRYFPEPDLAPMNISKDWSKDIEETLPELPDSRKERFIRDFELSDYEASLLSSSKPLCDYFEECLEKYKNAKQVSNWLLGDFAGALNEANLEIDECAVTPKHLIKMLKMIDEGKISGKIAKVVFGEMFETGKLPGIIIEEKGLVQISDEGALEKIIIQVIEEFPDQVEQYRSGKEKIFGFLVGQVMRLTQGKANPKLVNETLRKKLS
ncbi:MAG: Asp-tRNA(Asn)/Glu-tRNA(Gln) amidotransferase subunit GatB, partial [Actinomycetia bacterium]|nr:Asp-tRNA(Asn)/Glu-tRNA(Gln) amidotransferase subunit GatB [Actinomycetes bacterium]